MSYILEALKKSQAERQLGNAPTIHAPTLQSAPAHTPAARNLRNVVTAVAAVALVAAGGVAWWRRPAPVTVAAVVPPPAPQLAAVPAPAPVIVAPPPVAAPALRPRPAVKPAPAPVVERVPAVPAAPADDDIRYARDLPQALQQQLPQVRFGGYMYSDNAADRLVLVDKTLRHEGEEIAPGLTLEKLLPKGAVLNYRGTRYRVAF